MGTYLGPRAFYKKDMAKKDMAFQHGDLPPRCFHCRRSWDTTIVNGTVHCEEHRRECDGTCAIEEEEKDDGTAE